MLFFDKLLDFVQKYLFWLVLAAILLGLAIVRLTGGIAFNPIICIFAAVAMIYPSLVPLSFGELRKLPANWRLVLVSAAINFIFLPALAYYLGLKLIEDEPAMRLGLLLLAILPGGGMITTWAMKSRADMSLVVGSVFFNLSLGAILTPFYLAAAMDNMAAAFADAMAKQATASCAVSQVSGGFFSCGLGSKITPVSLLVPLVVIIIIPAIMAFATQRLLVKKGQDFLEKTKKRAAKISNLGLILLLLMLMSMSSNAIIFSDFGLVIKALLPVGLFYLFTFALSYGLFRALGGPSGKAMAWSVYVRYITLALGLATSLIFQDEKMSLIVIVIVLSYLIQIPTSFLMNKILNKDNLQTSSANS